MAQKPDGKPAQTERVVFTRPAADRIAKAVRIVEAGDRSTEPLVFERLGPGGGSGISVKRASWTANWSYNETATVTFLTATNATATATNVILGAGPGNGWIARSGSAGWQLVSVNLTLQPGYAANEIQVFGHSSTSALMQWYSITTCSTATAS